MSNSAVVRFLRRRFNFYYYSPLFNKYGRSLRDLVVVSFLTVVACILLLFAVVWLADDGRGVHTSCGTPECIDQ